MGGKKKKDGGQPTQIGEEKKQKKTGKNQGGTQNRKKKETKSRWIWKVKEYCHCARDGGGGWGENGQYQKKNKTDGKNGKWGEKWSAGRNRKKATNKSIHPSGKDGRTTEE